MKDLLISILRNKNTDTATFRKTTEKLASILAGEAAKHLEKKIVTIQTPISKAKGVEIKNDIVLIPILRSGVALMDTFIRFFEGAAVGFVGMKRDEKTAIPFLYYKNIPKISKTTNVIILDPMIATGGSALAALKILKNLGIKESQMLFVAVIASKEGLKAIAKEFPKLKIIVAQVDSKMTAKKFIDPGLGDFGDRYFVTE
ncbi:TPA: uracil phosphoribosyltransferase [Candidatus Dependentiae bacterium]|nr:MAG: Uracil phosphoribosyltransferase [candidate division TM6 bacterium GW2011_GWE2_31_21]KKP53855.1 MAG: Uracil phosphoribosyltransferase [candidate division TM6 bacterium GW2011_GWF2_33_332]HBS47635.1 uracil phosphoribosyltransferase [Candidatus Dependentiae bacterium]HBZ73784.1 uracil phosphoribosyltransferase [Candidatus Dependentiae bacterium]